MNFSRHVSSTRQNEGVGIDMTPMVDAVLTLLLFFMVTTTFTHRSQLKLQLPKAVNAAPVSKQRTLVLSINAKGRYYINGHELVNSHYSTLFDALRKLKKTKGNKVPLVIRADVKTPYQAVVTAMNVAGQLGLSRLSIATDKTAPARNIHE